MVGLAVAAACPFSYAIVRPMAIMPASFKVETGMLKLLNLLKDGRFHSGQALGEALGVSRSAVWKQLQHLESELNLVIHKVRGRGYQLSAPLICSILSRSRPLRMSNGRWLSMSRLTRLMQKLCAVSVKGRVRLF